MGFEIFRRCRWHEYRVTELQTEFLQIFQRGVVDHDVEDHDDNDNNDDYDYEYITCMSQMT